MEKALSKIGTVKTALVKSFNLIKKDEAGEYLPLVNYAKKDHVNYRPYCFSAGNTFNPVAVYANPYDDTYVRRYPFAPSWAQGGGAQFPTSYLADTRPVFYLSVAKEYATSWEMINHWNNNILYNIELSGLPLPSADSTQIESINTDESKLYPPQFDFKADGYLRPLFKEWKYLVDGQVAKTKSYNAKILRCVITNRTRRKFETYDTNGDLIATAPAEVAWHSAPGAEPDPADTFAVRIPFRINSVEQIDNMTGRVVATIEGNINETIGIKNLAVGDYFELSTVGGAYIEMTIEAYIYYEVPERTFEIRQMNNGKIETNYLGENNITPTIDPEFKSFSIINRPDSNKIIVNYLTKLSGKGYDHVQGDPTKVKYNPDILCSYTYDRSGALLATQHLPFNAIDPEQERKTELMFKVDSELWHDKTNLNYYLSKFNFTRYPHSYGTVISQNLIRLSTKNIPILEKPDDVYLIPATGEYNPLFTITNGIYTAVINSATKIIYFALVDGGGFFELDLNGIVEHDLDFFGFDRDNMQIHVGKLNEAPYTYNEYSIFDIQFIIDKKRKKLTYDFSKMNMSFIPCQTHCMGKDGIISKV